MKVDVIILTNTANNFYYDMTNKCIESLIAAEKDYEFKINVMESGKIHKYKGCKVLGNS